jgi:hypothetical protein
VSERHGEYLPASEVSVEPGWEAEVLRRLKAMLTRGEEPLVSIVQSGRMTVILIDRRVPAGRVVLGDS